jgi:signal transduction histidine kinase
MRATARAWRTVTFRCSQLEGELRQRVDELAEADRQKNEFLAMLGHELRNPLAPILTALQLMKLRDVSDSARERAVIERQVNHLTRLVDDLLDVSRASRAARSR